MKKNDFLFSYEKHISQMNLTINTVDALTLSADTWLKHQNVDCFTRIPEIFSKYYDIQGKIHNYHFNNNLLSSAIRQFDSVSEKYMTMLGINGLNKIDFTSLDVSGLNKIDFTSLDIRGVNKIDFTSLGINRFDKIDSTSLVGAIETMKNIINNPAFKNIKQDIYNNNDFCLYDEEDEIANISLASDDEAELENDLDRIYKCDNWQVEMNNAIIKWQERNPLVVRLLKMVVGFIFLLSAIVTIISFAASFGKVTSNNAAIRQEPSQNSKIIYIIPKDEVIKIVSEESYWYKIEYCPNCNELEGSEKISSEIYQGYIGKRVVEKLKSQPININNSTL